MDPTMVVAALVLVGWFVVASAVVIAIAASLRRRGLVIRLYRLRLVPWDADSIWSGLNRPLRRRRSRKG